MAPSRGDPQESPKGCWALTPLAHAGTWRVRAAVARDKQAMTKLRAPGNAWRRGDTWCTANPTSPGLLFRVASPGGPNAEPRVSTRHREERRRCSISVSWMRAVTRGWARESRVQEHRHFTQELSRAGPRTLLRHIYITMAFSGTREGKGLGFELGTGARRALLPCCQPRKRSPRRLSCSGKTASLLARWLSLLTLAGERLRRCSGQI